MPVNSTVRSIFSKARLLDSGYPTVVLSASELYSLFLIICSDLGWHPSTIGLKNPYRSSRNKGYYDLSPEWFTSHQDAPDMDRLQKALAEGMDVDSDFGMYFHNLCSLHKRRLKFQKILSHQPKPTMDQVGPRGLLEYGVCDDDLLNNWLIWRKWIFDIDNRAGQETGYLFEPILASCLGGKAVSSSKSPVKRADRLLHRC